MVKTISLLQLIGWGEDSLGASSALLLLLRSGSSRTSRRSASSTRSTRAGHSMSS